MAIIVGIVSQEDRAHIVRAGYTLADHPADLPLLKDMQPFGGAQEEAVAVWVDCDVIDLLSPDQTSTSLRPELGARDWVESSEHEVRITSGDVHKVAAHMGKPLLSDEAARIAAQVAAHLREIVEDEIEHALDTR